MPRALLLPLLLLIPIITTGCETCRDACRGPSPASCPAAPALPEPRAEGDGPPQIGRNCAELAGREPTVPPLCGPAARSCAPPCPPPQRVIVEVVHRHEKPPCPPAAPAPIPAPPQTLPTMASPTALLPVQPTAAYAVAPTAQRVGLGFALDFFRLPIPFLRPIPVALPAEQPAVMLVQAPAQAPPVMMPQPPQQFAHVPVSGTALVPVPPGPPSVMASPNALPPAMVSVCPPCPPVGAGGPGLPSVSASTLDALTREVDALRRAMELQRK